MTMAVDALLDFVLRSAGAIGRLTEHKVVTSGWGEQQWIDWKRDPGSREKTTGTVPPGVKWLNK